MSVCLFVCLRPPFLDDRRSDLIETCQEYCRGPGDVPFRGLISIGRAVPKLRPFYCFLQCWKGVYMAAESVVPPFHLIMPFFPKLIITRWPPVRSDWNLPGILPGTRGCAFSRFDINRMSGSQVPAILLLFSVLERCIYGSWRCRSTFSPYHAIFSQINNNQTTTGPIGLKLAGAPRMCLF